MDCRILRQLTLKSDGHLGCDDSAGYDIDLGHVVDSDRWRLGRVLNGPVYRHVRQAFARGVLPWPGVCERCDLLSDGAAPDDRLAHAIDLLVEPTLACDLLCACCARHGVLARGRDEAMLDPGLLRRLVRSAVRERIEVSTVNYAGQGEPLFHDRFPALVDAVLEESPRSATVVTTTGNVGFAQAVGTAPVEQVIVSCDAARAESYPQYRRGGQFDTVLRFMHDQRRLGWQGTRLEWKYIVFDFNDDPEELRQAQRLADDIGVDSLLFILTNSRWASPRWRIDNIDEFPIESPRARVNPAAAMNAVACAAAGWTALPGLRAATGCIDVCRVTVGRMLDLEGWATDGEQAHAAHVQVLLDGEVVARAAPGYRRDDVLHTHPMLPSGRCGFIFRIPVNPDALPGRVQLRVVGAGGHESWLGGDVTWSSPLENFKRRGDMPLATTARVIPIVADAEGARAIG
jgi:hypothetical protein